MHFKFTPPTYAGYPEVDAQIAECIQPDNPIVSQHTILGECGVILLCVMDSIDNRTMSFYSASATILGFIPTILFMIGTGRDDYLKIHKQFPILALLLSCCNPSTVIAGLAWRTATPPEDVLLKNHVPMGSRRGIYTPVVIHGVAMAAAGLVIWQAVILGMRGIISYSCPTCESPLVWVLVGPAVHIIDVIVLALADYVYGTIILSSMQLVTTRPALEITMFFAVPGLISKLISIFILEFEPQYSTAVVGKTSSPKGGTPPIFQVAGTDGDAEKR
ncbi:hypothetical protein B0H17DRAFT_1131809 [Mycena rosella]|uniref:Uncharacterized protein n=1 Tax=Mycena rosella TaxID=1033263 RepID=A0AAD7DNQ9_MYCRO|nr:hypothetical protein B0H17DRAFT_1131809 [Mycena rosella]